MSGAATSEEPVADDWSSEPVGRRWYPVIDGGRCIHCGHCLQFCLFGVYEEDAGRVLVRHPDRCKPGCPACSRICPHGAIIFPLYRKDEAIAGAPGTLMSPDPAARKMYYARTKLPCPRCGQDGPVPQSLGATCEECGRPVQPSATGAAFDDIDALIDELDKLAKI